MTLLKPSANILPMKKSIFIGIDGGGTQSKLLMLDEAGNVLAKAINGPANISISVTRSWQSINQLLQEGLHQAQLKINDPQYAYYAAFALAGCECESACQQFLKHKHPFQKIILTSDVYAACMGAHNANDGSIVAIGTGVVGLAIYQHQHIKVGGWGFPHGDEGGGAWLGLQACCLVFKWLDGRAKRSPMLVAIFEQFKYDLAALTTWANEATSTDFATLAPIVIKHNQQKDPFARQLMQQAADHIQVIILALDQQSGQSNLPLCLLGGIAPFLQPLLGEHLTKRMITRQHDAPYGAIMLIMKALKDERKIDDEESRW